MKITKSLKGMLAKCFLQWFFAFMLLADIAFTLKDMRVIIPSAVRRGENVKLICQYDLEGDTLYSLKWYKGKREFYRFTPKKDPSLQTFPIPGIYVETIPANSSYIVLKSVEPSISGKYICEISADAPSFHTLLAASDLEVIDVPQNKPIVTEIKSHYRIGDLLRSNCSSQYSRPTTNLTWLLNDIPMTTSIRQFSAVKDESKNLISSILGLFLRLSHQHFVNGRLKITCIASIYNLYKERVDKFIEIDQPNVFSASASQSYIDPQTHFSSYHDAYDAVSNHNDAQIQADMSSSASSSSSSFVWKSFVCSCIALQIFNII